MHLLIPSAASSSPNCQSLLPSLQLPHLQKLLARLQAQALDQGEPHSLNPPHERALARALGLPCSDGLIAWAAQQHEQNHGILPQQACGFVTLCHWRMANQQVLMSPLPLPELSQTESDTLLAAMQPYFAEDGITLEPDQCGRYLAQGALLADVPTASLDRVIGCDVKAWLPTGPQASTLLRLQNEMQMLFYTHPLNDAREARGLLPVNSFWLHGTGCANASAISVQTQPTVNSSLHHAALAEDWPRWAQAWQQLDATELPALLAAQQRGEPVQLTLCGERSAQSWLCQPRNWLQNFASIFKPQSISGVLLQL
jgi:hypothetical protein